MEMIGSYEQLTPFTNENAGTSEWCRAQKDGRPYFIKKFLKPVYPSEELELSEKKHANAVKRFHTALESKEKLYDALRERNSSATLALPLEVLSYQYHICTVTDYIKGNITAEQVPMLSPWQRVILMRTLTLALMNVHAAGVVHGDMKPDDLIITQNPETGTCMLKLIDFDSCYFASDAPASADDIGGDMGYWAPEIVAKFTDPSTVIDQRVDNFALGLVLHWLWTGQVPAIPKGQYYGQVLLAGESIVSSPSLPPTLASIVSGLMEVEPDKRLPLTDVYEQLGTLLDEFPMELCNLQPPEPEVPDYVPPVAVEVLFQDAYGYPLQRGSVTVEAGRAVTVKAKEIAGYELVSAEKVTLSVDEMGNPSASKVTFSYKRKASKIAYYIGGAIVALLVVCLIAFLANGGANRKDGFPVLSTDKTQSISFTRDSQSFTYAFTAPSSGTYRFSSTGSSDTKGYLYSDKELDRLLTSNDDGGASSNFQIDWYMTRNDTVYLKVTMYNNTARGSASVRVERSATAVSDSDYSGYSSYSGSSTYSNYSSSSSSTSTISLNSSKRLQFTSSKRQFVLSFTAPRTDTYTFYSTGATSSLDARAYLYSNSGLTNQLEYSDDYSGRDFRISRYITRGTTVYLKVNLYSTSGNGTIYVYVDD